MYLNFTFYSNTPFFFHLAGDCSYTCVYCVVHKILNDVYDDVFTFLEKQELKKKRRISFVAR